MITQKIHVNDAGHGSSTGFPSLSIHVQRLEHRRMDPLFLRFPFTPELNSLVKRFESARWSQTHKAWYIPYSLQRKTEVEMLLRMKGIAFSFSDGRKEVVPDLPRDTIYKVETFSAWMRSRRYSESTVNTYTDAITIFLRFFISRSVEELTAADLVTFNNGYILARKLSASYQNQVVNAVKLFFRVVQNKNFNEELVHRPRREHKLPRVLSKEEVKSILSAPGNLKHRAMLSLIYSCGLRRSELLELQPRDIDPNRKILLVRQAKSKRDRMVPLSEKVIGMLREYYRAYRPLRWLFEGQNEGERYSEKSLENVLKQALRRCGIQKPVSLRWLRHSYATHLLESGTDLRYIQVLLGHKSSRTTEIYTHVSSNAIQNIKSPFDDLQL